MKASDTFTSLTKTLLLLKQKVTSICRNIKNNGRTCVLDRKCSNKGEQQMNSCF